MTRYSFLLLIICSGVVCRGATTTVATPITPEQVAGALEEAGIHVSARQLTIPPGITASSRHPAMRIAAVQDWGDRQLRVRMECVNGAECLPFFVTAPRPEHGREQGVPGRLQMDAEMGREAGRRGANLVLHAGNSATLALEGPGILITLPVICLEAGRVGETIRVTSKDRRQTFSAEIAGPNELKAALR